MRFRINIDTTAASPAIELIDTATETSATIFCFGGLLNSYSIKTNDLTINVVDAYKNVEDAIAQKNTWFKSCRLSPFACRLRNGTYELNHKTYTIDKFYLGENAMHGVVYDAIYNIAEAQTTEAFALVALSYDYKGEDAGYPFAFSTKLIWKLEANNLLSVSSYVTNKTNIAIPYYEGWHPYFKLDIPIDECTLQMDADQMIEFDSSCIPTGKLLAERKFEHPTRLKDISLDNCYVLDRVFKQPKCVLRGEKIALSIIPDASYPYLQIFTPDHRKNIAIENLSGAPDAFNNNIGLQMLQPNVEYQFKTSYQLEIIN